MTLDEIRFVIQKKDGTCILNTKKRVTQRWRGDKRKVTFSTAPWSSWAAAERANLRQVRREIDGKKVTLVEPQGTVMAVKLMVL